MVWQYDSAFHRPELHHSGNGTPQHPAGQHGTHVSCHCQLRFHSSFRHGDVCEGSVPIQNVILDIYCVCKYFSLRRGNCNKS